MIVLHLSSSESKKVGKHDARHQGHGFNSQEPDIMMFIFNAPYVVLVSATCLNVIFQFNVSNPCTLTSNSAKQSRACNFEKLLYIINVI